MRKRVSLLLFVCGFLWLCHVVKNYGFLVMIVNFVLKKIQTKVCSAPQPSHFNCLCIYSRRNAKYFLRLTIISVEFVVTIVGVYGCVSTTFSHIHHALIVPNTLSYFEL
jgi:hypothetical protein